MSEDPLPYGLYFRDALCRVMRRALSVVAERGLPDNHFFHITFRTDHPRVVMHKALRQQYPTEMAIILQHVFHDLEVDDAGFSVTLSFNKVQQRLTVPFDSVTKFQDPPANIELVLPDSELRLALQAEADPEGAGRGPATVGTDAEGREKPAESGSEKRGNVIAFENFRKS